MSGIGSDRGCSDSLGLIKYSIVYNIYIYIIYKYIQLYVIYDIWFSYCTAEISCVFDI